MKKLMIVAVAVLMCAGLAYAADSTATQAGKDAVNYVADTTGSVVTGTTDTAENAVTGTADTTQSVVTDPGSVGTKAVNTVGNTANAIVTGTKNIVETATGTNISPKNKK